MHDKSMVEVIEIDKKKTKKTNTKNKKNKKKKTAFTLIELLAVIIILGILILIAIPSVTRYISDSRKETYIDTAKTIMGGARTLVNQGKLDMFDPNTTYYLPISCVKTENGKHSPYGDFTKAYVVVAYNGFGYDYYWVSNDTTGNGIKEMVSYNELTTDKLKSGVKDDDIKDDIAVGKRKNVVVYESDCVTKNTKAAVVIDRIRNGTLLPITNQDTVFGKNIDRSKFEKIVTVNNLNYPEYVIDHWDASKEHNESVIAWYTDTDNNGLYELYLGQEDGVIADANLSYAFSSFNRVSTIDLSHFDTSNTVSMLETFKNTGYDVSNFQIIGLDNLNTSSLKNLSSTFMKTGYNATTFNIGNVGKWDVSKVEEMQYLFYDAGANATSWNIGDLSNWNVSKVRTMYFLFSDAGSKATTWNIGNLSRWNVSNVTNMGNMFSNAGAAARSWSVGDLSRWNVSNVTSMGFMFSGAGYNATTFNLGNLGNWNVSKVTNMGSMFNNSGYNATTWYIGDLSNWDTSKVTFMTFIFARAGYKATNWNSIGTFKVYANTIDHLAWDNPNIRATFNIYKNPTSYGSAFVLTATKPGSSVVVNYTAAVTDIDNIVHMSSSTNVVKGNLIQ